MYTIHKLMSIYLFYLVLRLAVLSTHVGIVFLSKEFSPTDQPYPRLIRF